METEAALAAVRAIQIPVDLLVLLNLTGNFWFPNRNVKNNTCFEYIVIGAGTAGCVVANRLTENENNRVLLLEAGGDPPITTFFPPFFVLDPHSERDWSFTSTKDTYAASSQNYITKLQAGKCLGGSSSTNHYINDRGSATIYNDWAKIVNDSSWNYKNVLPYFKKHEDLQDKAILNSPFRDYHGTEGPIGLTRQPSSKAEPYLEALNETGNAIVLDLNGNITQGYAQSLYTVNSDGVRQSSANYLRTIRNRENLYVLRNSLAVRIVFEGNRAVAVATIQNGKIYVYRACKEIIVCAGVFNSPKLLMLSGIGPKEHLESLGIKVKADLPVGNYYQDQVATSLVYKTTRSILPPPARSVIPTKIPFPIIVGLKSLNPNQTYADYQTFSLVLSHATPFVLLACGVAFEYRPEICDQFNVESVYRDTVHVFVTLAQPKSYGLVRLNRRNPLGKPSIKTNFFQNKTDLNNMVKYLKDYDKISQSAFFKKVNATLIIPNFEECSRYTYKSNKFWRCYILHTAVSVYHSTSTCRMGSVVDSKLRVYNVTNLRVVDASVTPNIPDGSPFSAVMMIAEKGSDIIKNDSDKGPCCSKLYGEVVENLANERNGTNEE